MHYLVTGGAGFIGSHLSERIIREGGTVTVIDDLSTGSIDNLAGLKGSSRFRYVIESVTERRVLAELIDAADVVIHLAAAVGVRLIVESPVRTIETNVHGTEIVLELANKKKKRVVVASTSEIYGKSNKIPFAEDDDLILGATTRGRWSYACSKALDEFLALAYWKEKRLPTTVVRLFNTVGPRQTGRYGMVVPTFVRQALMEQPISVYGDGEQSRCFTHVDDAVEALLRLSVEPKAVGEVFNVGGNQEITINGLAEVVKEVTGSSSEIRHIPYAEAYEEGFEDMRRRVPCLKKVHDLIGFEPTKDLRTIVQDVADQMQDRHAPRSGFFVVSEGLSGIAL